MFCYCIIAVYWYQYQVLENTARRNEDFTKTKSCYEAILCVREKHSLVLLVGPLGRTVLFKTLEHPAKARRHLKVLEVFVRELLATERSVVCFDARQNGIYPNAHHAPVVDKEVVRTTSCLQCVSHCGVVYKQW